MVAGAGAIGNEVIKLLALLGVGHIVIVDFDTVEVSNLTRSVLFREGDIGLPKAAVAAERAREINPDVAVTALQGDLEYEVGLGVYRSMDVVIGCLDSLQARLALNRACFRAGVPWLNGGIEDTIAEVSLFQAGRGACFECGMSPSMWTRRNQRFSCGGLRSTVEERKMPTTAVVASLVAGFLINEALFILHALSPDEKEGLAFSQKLSLILKPYQFGVYDVPANGACLAHDRWDNIEVLPGSPRDITAAQLLAHTGMREGVLEIGYDLLTEMVCVACGARESVLLPVETCGEQRTLCPYCLTESRQPETISWIDRDSPYAEMPLAALGIPDYQVLAIKESEKRRFLQLSGEYRVAKNGKEG